jgi:protein-tyrosine phosphatase
MFKKIVFVCTGNICRSPVAEYLLKNQKQKMKVKTPTDITISSAGTHAATHLSISPNAKIILNEENIECTQHCAVQINKDIINNSDLILVMENVHKYTINMMSPESHGKVFLLGHWGNFEIADPYQQSLEFFRDIKKQIDQGLACWVKKMYSS